MRTSPSSSNLGFVLSLLFFSATVASFVACTDHSNDPPAASSSSSGGDPQADASTEPETDAGSPDVATDAKDSGITGKCADTFGDKLTEGFGRIDGLVWAVQKPSDTQCVFPNNDHVIIQVLMGGAVYRMVANVQSDRTLDDGGPAPPVRYAAITHALPPPAWADGWHTDVALDYPTTLGVHNDAFTPNTLDELVTKIATEVKPGDPISVYAQSGNGRPESAHLIHRNGKQKDGAIVVAPTSASPKILLFHFAEQVF